MSESVPVEYIVTRYFTKYNRLDSLIPYAFSGSKAKAINIYIDVYGLYKTLFSRSYRTSINDYTSFTTSIINMCSHYRGYFKNIGVYAKIFIISSYNVPEANCKFVAGYNKTMLEKLANKSINNMIDLNNQLLDLLCPYLPNIHFISSSYESSSVMDFLIRKEESEGNKNPNLIISSDIYPIQLTTKYSQTAFLRPKKSQGEDHSMIVCPKEHSTHHQSFWGLVCERDNLVNRSENIRISPVNFPLLMALNRFPERNITNLININAIERIIYDIVADQPLKVTAETIYSVSNELAAKVPFTVIDSRYKVLDIDYQSYLFDESLESKMIKYENLNDPDAVQLINSQYFSTNPIDVYRL